MAKNKISEFSSTPANNTDIAGINIAEGCAPSGINNAIRELMAQLKDQQTGADGDNFTVGGNLTVVGSITGTTTTQAVTDDSTKLASTAFVRDIIPSGVILMWSGSIATIPSGWLLCDGTNSTPDLRNRFVIGANADDAGVAKTNVTGSATQTGGSKDAIVVSHTHTGTTDTAGAHVHTGIRRLASDGDGGSGIATASLPNDSSQETNSAGAHNHTFTTASAGSSGTNANLVPYFALAYIMKS